MPILARVSCKAAVWDDGHIWLREYQPGHWELPGGSIEDGEQPEVALAREVREELGLRVTIGSVVHAHLYESDHGYVMIIVWDCTAAGPTRDGPENPAVIRKVTPAEAATLDMHSFYRDAISAAQRNIS